MEIKMKTALFLSALAAGVFIASTASFAQTFASPSYQYLSRAQDRLNQGQYPLQSSLGDRTAQPQCGFAATEDWGPNGFQWCDSKNIFPKPRIHRPDAFGQFVPSDRAGSTSTRAGRLSAAKFKVYADTSNSTAASASVAAQPLEAQGRFFERQGGA